MTALAGGAEVLAAILPKMDLLGDIGGDFIGVAASVFQHFNVGRPQGVDKVLDACVLESREFATDTELLTPVLELQGELSHQMVGFSFYFFPQGVAHCCAKSQGKNHFINSALIQNNL